MEQGKKPVAGEHKNFHLSSKIILVILWMVILANIGILILGLRRQSELGGIDSGTIGLWLFIGQLVLILPALTAFVFWADSTFAWLQTDFIKELEEEPSIWDEILKVSPVITYLPIVRLLHSRVRLLLDKSAVLATREVSVPFSNGWFQVWWYGAWASFIVFFLFILLLSGYEEKLSPVLFYLLPLSNILFVFSCFSLLRIVREIQFRFKIWREAAEKSANGPFFQN